MTDDKELQSAIDHEKQMARLYRCIYPEYACDHAQIAEWLEELQGYRKGEWGIEK